MEKYKSLVIILIISAVLQLVSSSFLNETLCIELARLKSSDIMSINFDLMRFIAYLTPILKLIIWLPLAIWVIIDSKKHLFLPLLWGLAIVFTGFQGVIIYLLVKLLIEKEKQLST